MLMMIRNNKQTATAFAGGVAFGVVGFGILSWIFTALTRRRKQKDATDQDELIFLYSKIARLMRNLKEIQGDDKAAGILENIDSEIKVSQLDFANLKNQELIRKNRIVEIESKLLAINIEENSTVEIDDLNRELEELRKVEHDSIIERSKRSSELDSSLYEQIAQLKTEIQTRENDYLSNTNTMLERLQIYEDQNNLLSNDLNSLRLHSTLLEQTIQGKEIQIAKLQEIIDSFDEKLAAETERYEELKRLKDLKEEELAQAYSQISSMKDKGLEMMRDFMDSTSKIEAERDDYLAKSHSLEADLKKLKNEHKKLRDIFKAMKKKTKESTPNFSSAFEKLKAIETERNNVLNNVRIKTPKKLRIEDQNQNNEELLDDDNFSEASAATTTTVNSIAMSPQLVLSPQTFRNNNNSSSSFIHDQD